MEFDAFVQYEGVAQTILGNAPFFCQQRDDLRFLIEGQESLVHSVGDRVGITITGDMRIQMSGVSLKCNNKVIIRRFYFFSSKGTGGKAECQSTSKHKRY